MLGPEGLRWRSDLLQAIRLFFLQRAYIEVDTPCRLPVLLPESHILPFTSESWFLQPSPEQCMKRLLARGCQRIFQICRCFRKEELGRLHQPEFTLLEWYHQGWSYDDLMRECEELITALCRSCPFLPGIDMSGRLLLWQGKKIAMEAPWERLTVAEAFRRYARVDMDEVLAQGRFDEVLVMEVEPHLGAGHPVFLYDYPAALGSLARRRRDAPAIAERFELYIAGIELVNGFSELVDPVEQRKRFMNEITAMHAAGLQAGMPEKFLQDLPALGETAGAALGVDRLFMLLADKDELCQAIPFDAGEV